MKSCNHIEGLSKVLFYSAPDNRNIVPKPLAEGYENVEILIDGEVFYTAANVKKRFGRGTIFWHRAGEFDIWETASADHGYRCICFTFKTNGFPDSNPVPTVGSWQDLAKLDDFISETRQLFDNPATDNDLLTAYVYGTLLRQFIPADIPTDKQLPRKLYLALLHINVNLPHSVSLQELSQVSDCSAVHLNRLFAQYMHCTPSEYIMRRRMLHAANLLTTDMSIKAIAGECSFKSLTGFYSAFRKYFNMSPDKYRKECSFIMNERLEK